MHNEDITISSNVPKFKLINHTKTKNSTGSNNSKTVTYANAVALLRSDFVRVFYADIRKHSGGRAKYFNLEILVPEDAFTEITHLVR